jgi:hypothetical protein
MGQGPQSISFSHGLVAVAPDLDDELLLNRLLVVVAPL